MNQNQKIWFFESEKEKLIITHIPLPCKTLSHTHSHTRAYLAKIYQMTNTHKYTINIHSYTKTNQQIIRIESIFMDVKLHHLLGNTIDFTRIYIMLTSKGHQQSPSPSHYHTHTHSNSHNTNKVCKKIYYVLFYISVYVYVKLKTHMNKYICV